MAQFVAMHQTLLWWMGAASLVVAVGSVLAVPPILARLPVDYLSHAVQSRRFWAAAHPTVRWPALVVKNILGGGLLLAGIAMLVLPGQGLLTIAVGVMLLDFPGRSHCVRWVMTRPQIFRAINWIRAREKRPPLDDPPAGPSNASPPT